MAKEYKRKSKEDKEQEVDELIEKANMGIENCFNSQKQIKDYLNYMSKFYKYSFRNTILIQQQFEGAMAVGTYAFWKDKGFTVNKSEKGIKILVPNKLSDYFINSKGEEVKVSKATQEEKNLIKSGKLKVKQGKTVFNKGHVFDVSQTNAKVSDIPDIFPGRWIDGKVENYDLFYKSMENIAREIGVNIIEPKTELGAAKGVSYPATREVALNPRNTELQNVKTLIHELAHAKLHTMETRGNYTTSEKEFQAELTAYTVCNYFGLDTSEYSFKYMKLWTDGKELNDKQNLLKEVRETSVEYIEIIENEISNEIDKGLENYKGLKYSSVREGLEIYNDIKSNEKDKTSNEYDISTGTGIDINRLKINPENNIIHNNIGDLSKAYRAYDSLTENMLAACMNKNNDLEHEM